jgi:hypothetical protein
MEESASMPRPRKPDRAAASVRPDREGLHLIGGRFETPEYRRFKILIAKLGWTTDQGVRRAVYELFEKFERRADEGWSDDTNNGDG